MNTDMPPRQLKVKDVVQYMKDRYRKVVSRQTVYNWMNKGIGPESLQYVIIKSTASAKFPTVRVTTDKQVDEFVGRSGMFVV